MRLNSRRNLTIQEHMLDLIYRAGVSPSVDVMGVLFDADTSGEDAKLVVRIGPGPEDAVLVPVDLGATTSPIHRA